MNMLRAAHRQGIFRMTEPDSHYSLELDSRVSIARGSEKNHKNNVDCGLFNTIFSDGQGKIHFVRQNAVQPGFPGFILLPICHIFESVYYETMPN